MIDLLTRSILNPTDYSRALHSSKITFKERIDEGNNCFSFSFSIPSNLKWKAGQHGVFRLPGKEVQGKKWRAFSIASSQHENEVKIATIISDTPSDFKQKLFALEPGEEILLNGPFGEFHVAPGTTMVGIAGGIGITPFRAIAYEIANEHKDASLTLIYAGKNNYFAFKEEFDKFANHPNITVIYVNTPDEVNAEIKQVVSFLKNKATYYISGSPGMIGAIRKALTEQGVKKIINDPFKGY